MLQAPEKIEQEDKLCRTGDECRIGHKHVYGLKHSRIGSAGGIRVAAYAACESDEMHGHEDAIGSHERKPEMNLGQRFAHHAAKHFRKPEISGGENSEDGGHSHDQMKVGDHVISGVEHVVHRRLRKKQTGKSAADEQRDETERKQHRRFELNLPTPQSSDPVKRLDGRGNADGHGQDGKRKTGIRTHAAEEHVVSPDHEAQETDSAKRHGHCAISEYGLARKGGEHVRGHAHAGQYRDVHLGMAEEPEEVLPE